MEQIIIGLLAIIIVIQIISLVKKPKADVVDIEKPLK